MFIASSMGHEIVDSKFIGNGASQLGGAIRVEGDGTVVERIKNCYFEGNTVPTTSPYTNGGAIYSMSTIKAIESCTFKDNVARYGQDVFSDGMATTLIRNSKFLTNETNGKARVVGPILACGSPANFDICPDHIQKCEDTAREKSSYGVSCGKSCELGSYGVLGSCKQCGSGKYAKAVSVNPSEACELCPVGRSNPLEGQVGPETCVQCEEGRYSGMGAPNCLKVCVRGQEQISVDGCRDCPAGKTSNDDTWPSCVDCPTGSIAAKDGSSYCERCEAGYVPNENRTECIPCPAGNFRSPQYPECMPCPRGEFAVLEGAPYCLRCSYGKIPNDARTFCVPCPANTFAVGAVDVCTPCEAGKTAYKEARECFACGEEVRSNQTALDVKNAL